MTREQLATVLERVADLPEAAHAELMESVDQIEAKYSGVYRLSDDERAAVRRGFEELRQGKFATEEEVAEVFARNRRP